MEQTIGPIGTVAKRGTHKWLNTLFDARCFVQTCWLGGYRGCLVEDTEVHCRVEDQSLFGAEVSGGCPAAVSERFRALKREAGSLRPSCRFSVVPPLFLLLFGPENHLRSKNKLSRLFAHNARFYGMSFLVSRVSQLSAFSFLFTTGAFEPPSRCMTPRILQRDR